MRPLFIFLLCLSLLSLSCPAGWAEGPTVGANAVARWTNPTTTARGNPLTNLAGINVWFGTSNGKYTGCYNAGLVSSIPLSVLKLTDGQYYIAVQAYNTIGGVSEFSKPFAFILKTDNAKMTPSQPPISTTAPKVGPNGQCMNDGR